MNLLYVNINEFTCSVQKINSLALELLQNELKVMWEVEKSVLEVAKNEAVKKYNEINEQVIALNA